MVGFRALAGTLAAVALVAAGAETAPAQGFREGTATPVARDGSPLAAKKAISRDRLRRILENQMDSVGGASGAYVYDADANSDRLIYSDSGTNSRILTSTRSSFQRLRTSKSSVATVTSRRESSSAASAPEAVSAPSRGSLVLVGDGDPALAQTGFAQSRHLPLTSLSPLANAVKDAGIRRVKGKVVADPTVFDGAGSVPMPGVNPDPGDLPTLSGLSFNRGTAGRRLCAQPGPERRRGAHRRAQGARSPGEREA